MIARSHRIAVVVTACVAGAVALFMAAGAGYQRLQTRRDASAHPQPGRIIDIGGRKMLINCSGAGSPTVILENGLGDISVEWQPVQASIAAFTRVCSYDRAGYGSSDAGPFPRTSSAIAGDLHALLQAAGEKPPYILVGHSFGGYNVRVFAGRHSNEVVGMALVDSIQEDQYRLLPPVWERVSADLNAHWQSQARWAPLQINLGYTRWKLGSAAHQPFFYLLLQSKYLKARASELQNIQASAEQARAAGTFDIPLIVLTAGKKDDAQLPPGLTAADVEAYRRIWIGELQPRLARLSPRGRQVIVPESGHDMPADQPQAIVSAVRELIQAANENAGRLRPGQAQ